MKRIEIPPQIANFPGARFILVDKTEGGGKKPEEARFLTDNNYPYGHPKLMGWIRGGGNYGVLCNIVQVFDADDLQRLREMGVMSRLPSTFVVETGSLGEHWYLIVLNMPEKVVLHDKDGNHLGEIQHNGFFVVGPGCLHKSGRRYTVKNDAPIATITWEELKKILEDCGVVLSKSSNKKRKTAPKDAKPIEITLDRTKAHRQCPFSISQVAWPDNAEKLNGSTGVEYRGSHPVHGSTRGHNFSVNPAKDTWRCWRHETGGGPWELLAVKHGVLRCDDVRPGCLRGSKFHEVREHAIKDGLIDEDEIIEAPLADIELIPNRIECTELPETLPDAKVTIVEGPPRSGKTDNANGKMVKARSGIFVAHNHAVLSHAMKTFRRHGGESAVHLEGKHRAGMCRKKNTACAACELYPNEHDEDHVPYFELEARAGKLLREKGEMTKDDVPADLCPYYTLKAAARIANYVFIPPFFLPELEPKALLVIDEDTTLAHFFPPSCELFKFRITGNQRKIINTLDLVCSQAGEVRETIKQKGRTYAADKALLQCFGVLDDMNQAIKRMLEGAISEDEGCKQLEERLAAAASTDYSEGEKTAILKKLEQYCVQSELEVDLKDYIPCLINLYVEKPLLVSQTGKNGYQTAFMIGDERQPCVNMEWIRRAVEEGTRILLIGGTRAEIFAKALVDEPVVIEMKDFKYARNFLVIPIDDEDNGKSAEKKIEAFVRDITGSPDSEKRHPMLIVVGSKEKQTRLADKIGGIAHRSRKEGEVGQKWNYSTGMANIIYPNSVVARGIDVDEYNVTAIHDCDFSTPFWTAATLMREPEASAVRARIVADEVTNCAIRMSPIWGGKELYPKVLVVPRKDLSKIKYLDTQILEKSPDLSEVAKLILKANIAGTVRFNDGEPYTSRELEVINWEEAVQEGRLLESFGYELTILRDHGIFDPEELNNCEQNILTVLKKARGKAVSRDDMRKKYGLRGDENLIVRAMEMLRYEGKITPERRGRKTLWTFVDKKDNHEGEIPEFSPQS